MTTVLAFVLGFFIGVFFGILIIALVSANRSRRDIWAYNPDVCDGDFCPMDCDHCPKCDDALEASENE